MQNNDDIKNIQIKDGEISIKLKASNLFFQNIQKILLLDRLLLRQ